MGEHSRFGVACAKSVPRRLACCRVSPGESRERSGRPSVAGGSKWIWRGCGADM